MDHKMQSLPHFIHTRTIRYVCMVLTGLLFFLNPATSALATVEEASSVQTDAKAVLLAEASTLQILAADEADTLYDVAGLSKLPALLVICEEVDARIPDLSVEVSVSQNAAGVSGPTAFIEAGEMISAAHLMKAAVMIGAGDAIVAMGEHLFGTEAAFMDAIVARMQRLSIPLKLTSAVGLGTQFSPRTLALIGAELMKSESFRAHSKLTLETIQHKDGRETELASPNRMLRNYAGCDGILTGSSPADGYSGVFSVQRGDTHLIAVVIGCLNSSTRFSIAGDMLDQAFATTRAQKLCEAGEILRENVRVKGGERKQVNLVAKESIVLLLDKAEPSLQAVEDIPEVLEAPLSPDTVVGTITYQTAQGEVRGKVEVVPNVVVNTFSFRDLIGEILHEFLRA